MEQIDFELKSIKTCKRFYTFGKFSTSLKNKMQQEYNFFYIRISYKLSLYST